MKRIFSWLIFLLLISNTGALAQRIEKPGGRCGDGVCDEFERSRGICRQDCQGQGEVQGAEREPPFKSQVSDKVSCQELMADLAQQPKISDFIYAAWLGRGVFTDEELNRAFRVAKNLGVRYLLVEFKWRTVEPEKGKWQWQGQNGTGVEYVISLAKENNISLIPYFDFSMPWVETKQLDANAGECEGLPSGRGQSPSPDPDEYANYAFAVVDKLIKGGVEVRYVELDNEESNLNDGYASRNCYIDTNAKKIKEAENAAYDKIKAAYPEVLISSTTFSFPGLGKRLSGAELDKERKNSFIKVYFGEEPKPKFDFLGLHETLNGSGNPFTTWEKSSEAKYEYNFGSYNDAYDIWRNILDKYGYAATPIFNLESAAVIPDTQDAELQQKAVFARVNALKNKVIGWALSQISGSKKFTENEPGNPAVKVGITKLADCYELREGYYGYYALMSTLTRYPKYEGKVRGELNSPEPWVEKFSDQDGNILYAAFIPYGPSKMIKSGSIDLNVGVLKKVKMTRSDASVSELRSSASGVITLNLDQHPVFLEVEK